MIVYIDETCPIKKSDEEILDYMIRQASAIGMPCKFERRLRYNPRYNMWEDEYCLWMSMNEFYELDRVSNWSSLTDTIRAHGALMRMHHATYTRVTTYMYNQMTDMHHKGVFYNSYV